MSPLEILAMLRLVDRLMTAFLPVQSFIKNLESKAGKKLGDMTDEELAALVETPTKSADELIGPTSGAPSA